MYFCYQFLSHLTLARKNDNLMRIRTYYNDYERR